MEEQEEQEQSSSGVSEQEEEEEEDEIVRVARIQALTAAARIAQQKQQKQKQKQQPQNPMIAIRAGWEGIMEKSQHKLEEIQKDLISKGAVHVSFLDRTTRKGEDETPPVSPNSPNNSNVNVNRNVNRNVNVNATEQDGIPKDGTHSNVLSVAPSESNSNTNTTAPAVPTIGTTTTTVQHTPLSTTLSTSTTTFNTTTFNTTTATTKENMVQSSIVWKRRSGYGKYSIRNAWEQRKLVLIGSTLQYFDVQGEEEKGDEGEEKGEEGLEDEGGTNKTTTTRTTTRTTSNPPQQTVASSNSMISSVPSIDHEEEDEEIEEHATSATYSGSNLTETGTTVISSIPSPATSPKSYQNKQKKDIRQLWEQAKENITLSIDGVKENLQSFDLSTLKQKDSVSQKNHNNLDSNSIGTVLPRGTIDLVKENAAIAAISVTDTKSSNHERNKPKNVLTNVSTTMNSPPPTPFGLSIMVKGETKWKLCFETQREQVLWLALLTDVVVQRSVDSYNEELIKSSVSGGIPLHSSSISISTPTSAVPPLPSLGGLTPIVSKNETVHSQMLRSPGDQKGALWQTESKYSLLHAVHAAENTADTPPSKIPKTTSSDILQPIESDSIDPYLIRKIHSWVHRFACKGPKISLSGLNLAFCAIFVNLLLLKAFLMESKVMFCWLVMMMNVVVGFFIIQDPKVSSDVPDIPRKSYLIDLLIPSHSSTAIQDRKKVNVDHREVEEKKYLSEPPTIIRRGFKPVAGSTTLLVANESDTNVVNGTQFIRWTPLDNQSVQVRSYGYLSTKKKIPAPGSLYELIAVEVCQSESQIRQFVKKVNLPEKYVVNDPNQRTWISPDIFVISLAVPTEEPSFSKSTTDGGGITVVSIYKMKDETRKVLKKITSPGCDASKCYDDVDNNSAINAIKLFEKWVKCSPTDEKMQGRFKMIPNVHNADEVGLPSYISKYCGKPVLIKRVNVTGFLSNHPELNAMEFDITLHPFPYLAKKAMSYLYENIFAKAIISLSYVIEGRNDDELPEALIGDGVKLLKPDPELTVKALNLFNGTSKRSDDTNDSMKSKQE